MIQSAVPRRTRSGTTNDSSSANPNARLTSRVSSGPSGSPCALAVLARLGEPLPMVVRQTMSVGLSTLRRADRLVVLDRGEIVEVGSHDELMEKRGAYWKLYEAQARNVDTEDKEPPRVHIPLSKVTS